ncbi:hypothetical protein H0H87_004023 [Tephrocybe sp. NHM501043]|nr:hypothetical protein H0H87_004023 [Tephrocybe sp. NHM501043]
MPPRAGSPALSSHAGSSRGTQEAGSVRRVNRGVRKTKKITPQQDWMSEEEVDQLINDSDEEDIPITQSVDESRRMVIQTTAGASSSSYSAIAGPSSNSIQPETTHVLAQKSSPTPERIASTSSTTSIATEVASPPMTEPLSDYTCPICFFPPTNATLTPCGHICCGSCLFMAVKSTLQRGVHSIGEANVARCPVCRAPIPDWDGKGGGVIGLKPRVQFEL